MKPIYIFSLPRSGSTFIQRMLSAHQDIATISESHLLLPFIYTLKKRGVYSLYNHEFTTLGIQNFCDHLPAQQEDYFAELRNFILRLYSKAAKNDEQYFLDKAGAYHLIINEIKKLFPDGKFIFLWRNPLAVIASIMESWKNGQWNLYRYYMYLFQGLTNLITAQQISSPHSISVQYEEVLINPKEVLKSLYDYLDIPYDFDVITNFSGIHLKGKTGDQIGIRRYTEVSTEPLHKWKKVLSNPLRKAWCRRYLTYIGKDQLAKIGYDLDDLLSSLSEVPSDWKYLSSDLYRIPYGFFFRFFEGRILRHKIQDLINRKMIYMHS